jgi:hypothetical protein
LRPVAAPEGPRMKLLEQIRQVLRTRHYALRTEECYVDWRSLRQP